MLFQDAWTIITRAHHSHWIFSDSVKNCAYRLFSIRGTFGQSICDCNTVFISSAAIPPALHFGDGPQNSSIETWPSRTPIPLQCYFESSQQAPIITHSRNSDWQRRIEERF